MNVEPLFESLGPEVWSVFLAGGAMGLAYHAHRLPESREQRDARWAGNAAAERDFQLQMGFARAADKERFMRQHFGFPRGAQ